MNHELGHHLPTASLFRCFVFAGLALAGESAAQQTITRTNITKISDLVTYFAAADANPANTYNLYLGWVQDANGATVPFYPSSPLTLNKGKVNVYGSNTHLYPDKYVFDGRNMTQLFVVYGTGGYKPILLLSGLTLINGYSSGVGGACRRAAPMEYKSNGAGSTTTRQPPWEEASSSKTCIRSI